jgi:hypothetical protein
MEAPDNVASGYRDGLPLLNEIRESDWELIEYLADLPMQRGDVYTSCTITAERARHLLEMPIDSIDSLIGHLVYLRRDDLVDSLVLVDQDNSIIEGIILRWRADNARTEALERRAQASERTGATAPAVDPRAVLIAQAQAWGSQLPTVQDALHSWQRRQPGSGQDWGEWFRHGSVFALGETAILSIAAAVGVPADDVRCHAAQVAAREDLLRRQVEAAYADAAELLRDAAEAGGWGGFGTLLEMPPTALMRRFAELTDGQVSRPG